MVYQPERNLHNRIKGHKGIALRKLRLSREPLCRICKSNGKVVRATTPDHIIPLSKGGTEDSANIRCLCAECHRMVTAQQFGYAYKVRVTHGEDGWPTGGSANVQRR